MQIKYFPAMLAAVACLSFNVYAFAEGHSAIDPVPRGDQWWKDRHELINKRASEAGEKSEIIFIGDSITQGWEGEGKDAWAKNFAPRHAVNLGIGGDRTQHVLWRLENGNIKGLKPKAAVVMIGTNNSNGEDNSVEQIAEGIQAIVKKLRETLPETKVLLLPIFPRGENPNPQRGKINQVNQIIHKLVDGTNVRWVDFGHKFITDDGRIPREIMPDYLHLSKQGYEIWASSLERPLRRVIGDAPAAAATAPDLSAWNGNWIATLPGPNNEPVEVPFTLQAKDQTLTGAFKHEEKELAIEKGKRDNDNFTWEVRRTREDGGVMTYKMNGKLEGGKIAGKATTDVEGTEITIDWTARKQ
ncbi:MAG: platelet-activating factor acetylhydrolase IB subunit [Verrucomicrobiales bacterium]